MSSGTNTWLSSGRTGVLACAALLACVSVAVVLGGIQDGQIGPARQHVADLGFGWWALYATANSLAMTVLVVGLSTPLGLALGVRAAGRRGGLLPRWFELTCALPAFVITALWAVSSPETALVALSVCVGSQRAVQIAVLVRRAEQARRAASSGSLYPIATLELGQFGRFRRLLWLSAAHSCVILAGEHAALVSLGLISAQPNTWVSTLCAAMLNPESASPAAVVTSFGALLAVPWGFWSEGRTRGPDDGSPP